VSPICELDTIVFLYLVFLFFVKSYDEVHVIDSARNIGVRKIRSYCKLVRYDLNFSVTYNALRY